MPPITGTHWKKVKAGTLYTEKYGHDNGKPTGNSIFRFSISLTGVANQVEDGDKSIPLFDAGEKSIKLETVEEGTIGKVSFTVYPYFLAVQGGRTQAVPQNRADT